MSVHAGRRPDEGLGADQIDLAGVLRVASGEDGRLGAGDAAGWLRFSPAYIREPVGLDRAPAPMGAA